MYIIFAKYAVWSTSSSKKSNKFIDFIKNERKNCSYPPEIILLLYNYMECTKCTIDINKLYNDKLTDKDYKFFEITILNLHLIFNFIKKNRNKIFFSKIRAIFLRQISRKAF